MFKAIRGLGLTFCESAKNGLKQILCKKMLDFFVQVQDFLQLLQLQHCIQHTPVMSCYEETYVLIKFSCNDCNYSTVSSTFLLCQVMKKCMDL